MKYYPRKIKFRQLLLLFLLPLFSIAIITGFFTSYHYVEKLVIEAFNEQQLIHAKDTADRIEHLLEDVIGHLEHQIRETPNLQLTPKDVRSLLNRISTYNDLYTGLARMDRNGILAWSYPNNSVAGTSIADQPHIRRILQTRELTVSDVFSAVEGMDTVAIHVPIFNEGEFDGSLSALIPFDTIVNSYLKNVNIGNAGYAWVISEGGIEIYCPVPDHTGRHIEETIPEWTELNEVIARMRLGESGIASYSYNRSRSYEHESLKKQCAFHPIRLHNTFWSIAVATPEKQITRPIRGFRNILILLILVLMLFAVLYTAGFLNFLFKQREEQRKVAANKIIRHNEEQLSRLLDSLKDGVVTTDKKEQITRINSAGREMASCSEEKLPGCLLSEAFTVSSAKPYRIGGKNLILLTDRNGEERIVRKEQFPLGEDKNSGRIHIFREVTEIIRQQERQLHSEKLESMGKMAGGMAHDLNNMLTGILGGLELIKEATGESRKLAPYVTMINNSVRDAGDLTRSLLDFSRSETATPRRIEANEVIQETITLLRHSLSGLYTIDSNLKAEDDSIFSDPSRLKNSLLNIAFNSRDAMPNGGKILFTTENRTLSRADCIRENLDCLPGDYLTLIIDDTGGGIPQDQIPHIFDPFYTTKSNGENTGLGLAGVYSMMIHLGGEAKIYSREKLGTRITLFFPKSDFAEEEDSV